MTAPVSSLRHGRRTAMARAVATAAFALGAGGSPIAASAPEPQLAPNPNEGSITIDKQDVANYQEFFNYGSVQLDLTVEGGIRTCCVLINWSTLNNLIHPETGAIGQFNIYGYLYNTAGAGVINNAGSFIIGSNSYSS